MSVSKQNPHSWMHSLPLGWRCDRLSKTANVLVSNVDKKTEEDEEPVLLCNYVDVYKNDKITAVIPFMEATATQHEIDRFTIYRGDVLATKDSESPFDIAVPATVAENLEGILCGYHLAILRANNQHLHGPFLGWIHLSQAIRSHYEMHATGITRWAVGRQHFRTCQIPLPPLPEQKRIAAYLDASCAAIDRAVATKRQQLETLDAVRKSIIQKAVTQGLNPEVEMKSLGVVYLLQVPSHWRVAKLKRLIAEPLSYGLNEPGTEENPEWPRYIRITDFGGDGKLRDETFRSLPPEVARAAPLDEGDILLARSGATVGKSFLFTNYHGDACYAGYLIKARVARHLIMPDFLYLYTRSLSYEAWKNLIFTQATIQNISATKYGYLEVPVPPLDEQVAILSHLSHELARTDQIETVLNSQIETLTAYRKSLIHECVTGQRRISESDVANINAQAKAP